MEVSISEKYFYLCSPEKISREGFQELKSKKASNRAV